MAGPGTPREERRLEQGIGWLLRAGLVVAASVVVGGGAVYLLRHGGEVPDYRVFRGEPAGLKSLSGILEGARELQGRALIGLGLLVLLATPVARVAFALVAFARERDRLYASVSLFVLIVLLYSILGSGRV